MNFPEYPNGFSKLNRILYVGIGHDNEGLEELAENHSYVVGIDKHICDTPHHVEERENTLKRYPNLSIREMDARRLNFPDKYFDGVIFKRSLAWGTNAINGEGGVKHTLDETNRVLYGEGLVWIIYALADTSVGLTLEQVNSILKDSGFEVIETTIDYMLCKKIEMQQSNAVNTKAKNQKSFLSRIKELLPHK